LKLVVAVLQDRDWPTLRDQLVEHNFRFTRLSSSGGFLRQGNTTLMLGVQDEQVDEVISLIRRVGKPREEYVVVPSAISDPEVSFPVKVTIGGGTIFVIDVDSMERI